MVVGRRSSIVEYVVGRYPPAKSPPGPGEDAPPRRERQTLFVSRSFRWPSSAESELLMEVEA